MDNSKLFVGNVSWGTTDDSLKAFFEQVGTVVEAKIIIDRRTGRSKGFGFVTMSSPEEANKAVAELNGQDLDGRQIKVTNALPPRENSMGGDRGRDRF
jgi:RNA recognition motif-containing protein